MFYGRTEELNAMKPLLERKEMSTFLIYGRRRVGKTELILEAVKEAENIIYYECQQTSEKMNIEGLKAVMTEVLEVPGFSFDSVGSALEYLFRAAQKEPIVLVLDEYCYWHNEIKGMDSILQSLIDKYRKTSYLKLILCGSYIDVMYSLLEVSNPLHGRMDFQMQIHPMDYYESSLFYPAFSEEDKIRLYSIFGGIPYYNRLIREELSVEQNVERLILAKGAVLADEISLSLQAELNKVSQATAILQAIAHGAHRPGEICDFTGIQSPAALAYPLEKLIQLELITRVLPINEKAGKKRAYYTISDPFTSFYFSFISRRISSARYLKPEIFFDKYIREQLESQFVPEMFEQVCREFLIRKNKTGDLDEPFFEIGKFFYNDPVNRKNGEFDVVTLDDLGYSVYEAKFRSHPMTASEIDQEIRQVQACGLPAYQYGFISRSGFACSPRPNCIFWELKDLYDSSLHLE